MNIDRHILNKTADDIRELMDDLGFSAEYPIDSNNLRAMIVDVLLKNLDQTPVLVTGVKPEPFEITSTTEDSPDGECQCGCGYQKQPVE